MGRSILVHVLQKIVRHLPISEQDQTKLYYLKRLGYITSDKSNYTLSLKGIRLLNEEAVWSLTISKPKVWDKKWHLVLFDIPKDKRKRRDAFRLRLKELGLVLYQNSVWIYPYPLQNTIEQIAAFYALHGCVSFITADALTGEKNLLQHFKLKRKYYHAHSLLPRSNKN